MGLRGAGTGTGGSSRRVQREHGRGLPLPKSPAGPPGPLPTRTRCVCSRCRWGCLESRGMSGGEITDLHNFAGLRWSREVSTATRSSVSGVPNTPRRGFSRSGARLSGAPCRREAVPPRNLTRGGGAGGGRWMVQTLRASGGRRYAGGDAHELLFRSMRCTDPGVLHTCEHTCAQASARLKRREPEAAGEGGM